MRPSPEAQGWERLYLLPLGPVPGPQVARLAERLSRHVRLPCRLAGDALAIPLARLPDRDQLDADLVLGALESQAPGDGVVVGVTPLDMAIPIFTFVFGRARQGGRAAVVSLARLDPAFYGLPLDADLLARRTVIEILHELGHLASLRHCSDAACLMSFAASVERIDARGAAFCASCAARLAPLPRA